MPDAQTAIMQCCHLGYPDTLILTVKMHWKYCLKFVLLVVKKKREGKGGGGLKREEEA